MIDCAHCIERMGSRPRSRRKTCFRFTHPCIAVSHAATHAECGCMFDQLFRSGQLRGDGHQGYFSLCGLPEAIEQSNRGDFEQRIRVNSTLQVGKEGSLQMDSEGGGAMIFDLRLPSNFSCNPCE